MTCLRWRLGEWGLFALLVGPNLLLLAAFTYWPLLFNAYLSLTEWNMLSPERPFVGLENYRALAADPGFWRIVGNTFYFVGAGVAATLALALAAALLLNQRQGKLWWVPFARSTPMLYFNEEHLKEAGLADRAPESWAELLEWAPKLARREGGDLKRAAFGMPLGASYNAWVFQPVVWQWGGRYSDDKHGVTIAEARAVEAGQHYQDLVFKHRVASVPKDHIVDFQNGLIATIFASTASLAGIESNAAFGVGTGFLPKGPAGFGCCTGGPGLALLAASAEERRAAAFEYVRFATSPEHTAWWSQNTGYMPVRKSALEGPSMAAFYREKPNFQTAVKQLPRPGRRTGRGWGSPTATR